MSYWRRMLVRCVCFAGTQLDVSHVLALVSFDCHPGSPFFLTSERHDVIARLCLILPTPLALSADGHSCFDNNTRSLSSVGHSLDLCAQMSPPACPVRRCQLRALWGLILISLLRKPALQQAACRMCDGERGQHMSTAPSSALSPRPRRCLWSSSSRPRSARTKSLSRWKLIAPFYWNSSVVLILLCVMNYAHLLYGMQMASAARAWMYRQPQED
jgi:hypothetical protein